MMTTSWMEVLTPSAPFYSNSDWLFGQQRGGGGTWTREENKRFEDALAKFDRDTPERWQQVAAMIPGKTVADVMSHYRELLDDVTEIEAGRVPCSAYGPSAFTLDWDGGYDFDGLKHSSYYGAGKRSGGRAVDQERKKGVPWTEDEHKRFLLGLKKYGKGDWRSISRNFVITRTPTQVASHAQKYFIRLNSGGKDKRRSSIHDITTANLPDNKPLSPTSQPSTNISQSGLATTSTSSSQFSPAITNSNKSSEVAIMFDAPAQEIFIPEEFGICPYRMKLQAQNSCNGINLADTLVQEHHLLFPNAIGSSNH